MSGGQFAIGCDPKPRLLARPTRDYASRLDPVLKCEKSDLISFGANADWRTGVMRKARKMTVNDHQSFDGERAGGVPFSALAREWQCPRPDGAAHPDFLLKYRHLEKSEQRQLLAALASDLNVVPGRPALRRIAGSNRTVFIDTILDALKRLDEGGENQSLCTSPPSALSAGCLTSGAAPP